MASFPPRVNEKEIGEAQDGGGARGRRAECEGAGSGAGEKRGWVWGMGEEGGPMPRPTRNGGPDAEAPERRRGAKTGAVWREEAVPRWASAGSEWTRAPERASEFAHHPANPSDTHHSWGADQTSWDSPGSILAVKWTWRITSIG